MLDRIKSATIGSFPITYGGERVAFCCGINCSNNHINWEFDTLNKRFLNKFEIFFDSIPKFNITLTSARYDVMIGRFTSSSFTPAPEAYSICFIGRFDIKAKMLEQPLRYKYTKVSGGTSMTIDIGQSYFTVRDKTSLSLADAVTGSRKIYIAGSSDTTALPVGTMPTLTSSTGTTITIPCSASTTTEGYINLYLTKYESSIYTPDFYDKKLLRFSIQLGYNLYGNMVFGPPYLYSNSYYGFYISANFTPLTSDFPTYIFSYNDSIHNDFIDMAYIGVGAGDTISGNTELVLDDDDYIYRTVFTAREMNGATNVVASIEYVKLAYIPNATNEFYEFSQECTLHTDYSSVYIDNTVSPSSAGAFTSILMYIRRYGAL